MHDAVVEAVWTSDVLSFLRKANELPIDVYSDSQSAEKGVTNNLLTKRNRSYKARLHDLADKVVRGSIKIFHAPTETLPADSMTKATGKIKHTKHFEDTRGLHQWQKEIQRPYEMTTENEHRGPNKRTRYL